MIMIMIMMTEIFSQGKELNMVFGFQLSVARVGSTVNFLLMGWVLVCHQ